MIEDICINNQLTHYQLAQVLIENDIKSDVYRSVIALIHNKYVKLLQEIADEEGKGFFETYVAFCAYVTSHSKAIFIPQECQSILITKLNSLLYIIYNNSTFEEKQPIPVPELVEKIKSMAYDDLKENVELIKSKLVGDKGYTDILKDEDFEKCKCYRLKNLIVSDEYKDIVYSIKYHFSNTDFKNELFRISTSLELPYKFILYY